MLAESIVGHSGDRQVRSHSGYYSRELLIHQKKLEFLRGELEMHREIGMAHFLLV